jgi:hypothetical protein
MYQKPTHTGRYLHFKSSHPHHVKRGVVYSLISRAKVIYEDLKDFNNEIKNISHDLMLNEYPQEFADSVMKPSRSNRPSSDTIYHDTVIVPYVKGISEKFRRTGNRFNARTIFKTQRVKVTLRLAVHRQSIRFGAKPLATHDQYFFSNWTLAVIVLM